MHDYTDVRLQIQNDEDVVFTYEVDEYGYSTRTLYVERADNYRHERYGLTPTYVCECGSEYAIWQDVLDHLAVFAQTEAWR